MPNPDRSTYVSPSEVGALFGVSPWKTKFQIWHEKKENIKRRLMLSQKISISSVTNSLGLDTERRFFKVS